MRHLYLLRISAFLLVCGISTAVGFSLDKKTSSRIDEAIARSKGQIIKIRRFIHMNPELGYKEYETSKIIASRLLALGLDVESGIAETGVVGLLHGNRPGATIGIRASMDAFPIQEMVNVPFKSLNPGIMHAEGNDINTVVVLGTAAVLSSLRDQIKGKVKFIFQPAEATSPEGEVKGASRMIQAGVLENPPVKALFGFHSWTGNLGQVWFVPGPILAGADKFSIVIKRKNSQKVKPREEMDIIAVASHVILNIQSMADRFYASEDPATLSIGTITGGTKADISAEMVRFEGMVRAVSEKKRNLMRQFIKKIVKGITTAYEVDYQMDFEEVSPSVSNHPELAKVMLPTLQKVVGEKNVHSIAPQLVSDDFSRYCQTIPGFYFLLGIKNPTRKSVLHLDSSYFYPDERSISLGIKIMCHLALDSLAYQNQEVRNPDS